MYNIKIIPQKREEEIKKEITMVHKTLIQDILKEKGLVKDSKDSRIVI